MPAASSRPLLFEGFLALLGARGLEIGLDHHLRLHTLLDRVGVAVRPDELKGLLCPIFARNATEQTLFYELFDAYFALFDPDAEEQDDLPGAEGLTGSDPAETRPPPRRLSTPRRIALALAVLLLGGAGWYLWPLLPDTVRRPVILWGVAPPAEENAKGHPRPTPLPQLDAPTSSPEKDVPDQPVSDDDTPLSSLLRLAIVEGAAALAAGYLGWEAVAWLLAGRRRSPRRPVSPAVADPALLLERTRSALPAVGWRLGSPAARFLPYQTKVFRRALHALVRRRPAGVSREVDAAGSVRALVAAGGYPAFCYRQIHRVPASLCLIDRFSLRDHQAHLFDTLVRTLRDEGASVEVYHFNRDARVVVGGDARRHYLRDLQKGFPGHRLLVFGDGEGYLDPLTGALAAWTTALLPWRERAVLTPVDPALWDSRERSLGDMFQVVPATTEGLLDLGNRFDGEDGLSSYETGLADGNDVVAAPDGLITVETLRAYLGRSGFGWMCRCAVYPELHWSLTSHLLSLAGRSARRGGTADELGLLRLFRLPWFRQGEMTDDLRLRLLAELDGSEEAAVRRDVVRFIEHGSLRAADSTRDGLTIWSGAPGVSAEAGAADGSAEDYALLSFVRPQRISRLVVLLPRRIKRRFFDQDATPSMLHPRVLIVCAVLVLFFMGLSARLVNVSVDRGEQFAAIAAQAMILKQTLPAQRGSIRDRHGEVLACDMPLERVVVDGSKVRPERLPELAKLLAGTLGLDEAVVQKITPDRRYLILKRQVSLQTTEELRGALEQAKFSGVYFEPDTARVYPNGSLLCHVVGFMNFEGQGIQGIEKSMDRYLEGHAGYRYITRDRSGAELVQHRGLEQEARNGYNVQLTIDLGLQTIVEHALDEAVKKYTPASATVILLRPSTGEILAMASRPYFDINERGSAEPEMMKNRAILDMYEPGSVFKCVAIGGALNEKLVGLDTPINCEGGHWEYAGKILHDDRPLNIVPVRDVLTYSSNIGAAKIAMQLGENRFYDYIKAFGYGDRTGVDLPGEIAGLVTPPSQWSKISITRIPMGAGIAVTPLQVAMSYVVIANRGKLMIPQIVRAITDDHDQTVASFPPVEVRRVISPETAQQLTVAMADVVQKGTAQHAAVPGYRVAGKTGTAQKASPSGGYLSERYIVSFAGFLPAEDPQLVGCVVIDDPVTPLGEKYGGLVAAPIFADIATQAMRYLDVPPTSPVK